MSYVWLDFFFKLLDSFVFFSLSSSFIAVFEWQPVHHFLTVEACGIDFQVDRLTVRVHVPQVSSSTLMELEIYVHTYAQAYSAFAYNI